MKKPPGVVLYNFAVNFPDGYREFKTLKSAHTGIRAHLRGAA